MIDRSTGAIDLPKNSPSPFPKASGKVLQLESLIVASVVLPGSLFRNLT